jgi:hypothetical protein
MERAEGRGSGTTFSTKWRRGDPDEVGVDEEI